MTYKITWSNETLESDLQSQEEAMSLVKEYALAFHSDQANFKIEQQGGPEA